MSASELEQLLVEAESHLGQAKPVAGALIGTTMKHLLLAQVALSRAQIVALRAGERVRVFETSEPPADPSGAA